MELPIGVTYASFGRRVMATVIDSILLLMLMYLMVMLFGMDEMFLDIEAHAFPTLFDLVSLIIIIALWVRYGATPGKMLLDCKIVDSRTGADLKITQSIIRYFGYIVAMVPLFIGIFWILVSKRNQGFHDLLAKTVVLYIPQQITSDSEADKSIETLMKDV